ncbi:MAG: polymerase [Actinomycetia bacterium]|nr:polymerase [Actinomycetes bacterium]
MMFIGSLCRKIRVTRPTYLVIAWDGLDAGRWRRELYPPYKANRGDPGGVAGIDVLAAMEFCAAAGMLQLDFPAFEADDLLAAVHRARFRELPGAVLVVCSDDRDMFQLADDGTVITGLTTNLTVTPELIKATWGVAPGYLPYVRALAGDPSDNIPGLPGVGVKKAVRMLSDAGMEWPLPEAVLPGGPLRPGGSGADRRDLVAAWQQVMNLLDPPLRPESVYGMGCFSLEPRARWSPEKATGIGEVLDKYELSDLSARNRNGRLW